MAVDEVREFSAEQILSQSSAYPAMADGECQMSTAILSAAYPELRYVKGMRRRIYAVPGAEPETTEVVHYWNEQADGTIVDSAFQPGPKTARDLPYVMLRYIETGISEGERDNADRTIRMLRQGIKQRMKTRSGFPQERRREVVEELRDDLPRFRDEYDPVTPIEPRYLRGDDAIARSRPNALPEDPEIPPAFRRHR